MPKSYVTSSCGFPLTLVGPASAEEYTAAGGNVVEDAVTGVIAWDTLPDWQDRYAKAFSEEFGVSQAENEAATAAAKASAKDPSKVKPVLETVAKFLKREVAKLDEAGKKRAAQLAQEVADAMVSPTTGFSIDVSPSRRKGKPKAEYLEKADSWLRLTPDEIEAKITTGLEYVPGYPLERDAEGRPERESLARFIQAYVDAKFKAEI